MRESQASYEAEKQRTTSRPTTPSTPTQSTTPGEYVYGDMQADYTDDPNTRFNGLPGQPEVWYEEGTGKVYMVYFPEGMEPPVPLLYWVPNEEILKSYFGNQPIAYDKRFTPEQLMAAGSIVFGESTSISPRDGDPWAGFVSKMQRAREVMPWLDDPEVFSIVAGAYLEGRAPEDWELEATDWWQSHTAAEREWVKMAVADPATAAQRKAENLTVVADRFTDLGIEVPDAVLSYMADRFTFGKWSESQLDAQIRMLIGWGSPQGWDADFRRFVESGGYSVAAPTNFATTVRSMWSTWLGPLYQPSEEAIQEWSRRFTDNSTLANQQLQEYLREQRLNLYANHTNPNATYEDIASPWRSFVGGIWGFMPDDTDEAFQTILRYNDPELASRKAREVGMERKYEQVVDSAVNDLRRQLSTNVRGVV